MADHYRKSVRDAAAAAIAGLATTGAHVFNGRVSPLEDAELPGLVVLPVSEEASDEGEAIGATSRRMQLVIEAVVKVAEDTGFDTLDRICGEVETAMMAGGATLSGTVLQVHPPQTDYDIDDFAGQGSKRAFMARMSFPVEYRTNWTDPTTAV